MRMTSIPMLAGALLAVVLSQDAMAVILTIPAEEITLDLNDGLGEITIRLPAVVIDTESGLNGSLTLGKRSRPDISGAPEGNLNETPLVNIYGADILDYRIEVPFVYDNDGNTEKLEFIPANSDIEILFPALEFDGASLNLNADAVPQGAPLINVVATDEIAFPNGRRAGDDVTDLLLLALFRGSINFGSVFIDEGTALGMDPVLIQAVGQVTPDNTLEFATVVPLPASLALLAPALGLLARHRRRRGVTPPS